MEIAHVHAVEEYLAFGDVVQTRQQIGERRLAAPGAPDDAHRLPRLDHQVEVAQDPLVGLGVLETDAAKLDPAPTPVERVSAGPVGNLRWRIEDFVEPVRSGLALLAH